MRVVRSCLLLVVLLIPAFAHAGHHKADLLVAPSYLRAKGSTDDLGGWHVSAAVTVPRGKEEQKDRRLSVVGDLSTHFFGSDGGKDLTQITFMVGPRWTFRKYGKWMPFTQVMVLGAVYQNDGRLQTSTTAGALAFGAGFDLLHATEGHWGLRVQSDYIQPVATEMKGSLRVSVGCTFLLLEPHSRRP